MELAVAKKRYKQQRNQARTRGIGWELTFQQWLDWWGADLGRRGRGAMCLQMQRIGDIGPYALDNIRKGTPHRNALTRTISTKNQLIGGKFKPLFRKPEPPPDEVGEDEEWLRSRLGIRGPGFLRHG